MGMEEKQYELAWSAAVSFGRLRALLFLIPSCCGGGAELLFLYCGLSC